MENRKLIDIFIILIIFKILILQLQDIHCIVFSFALLLKPKPVWVLYVKEGLFHININVVTFWLTVYLSLTSQFQMEA